MPAAAVAVSSSLWGASVSTAVPQFNVDLSVDTSLVESGPSLRFKKGKALKAFAVLPVTAANKSMVQYLEIRAQCKSAATDESIVAELVRVSRAGAVERLGMVNTTAKKNGVGIHRWSAKFAAHTIDAVKYSYYVHVTLQRTMTANDPGLYSIQMAGLCDPDGPFLCPPGPPEPEPPIPPR